MESGESDGCGGVASKRLGDDTLTGECWNLFADGGSLFGVSDGPDALGEEQRT